MCVICSLSCQILGRALPVWLQCACIQLASYTIPRSAHPWVVLKNRYLLEGLLKSGKHYPVSFPLLQALHRDTGCGRPGILVDARIANVRIIVEKQQR